MVAFAEGVLAFAALILLPLVVTWVSVRSPMVRRLVKNEPRLLIYDGRFLQNARQSERITESEVLAVVRKRGMSDLQKVGATVLETDGNVTVISRSELGSASALMSVGERRIVERVETGEEKTANVFECYGIPGRSMLL
jgi:uncharacterized membrane protein YcaP (DUF421 family)